jgi:hypothetical protein
LAPWPPSVSKNASLVEFSSDDLLRFASKIFLEDPFYDVYLIRRAQAEPYTVGKEKLAFAAL